jgi:hypothetical protein
MLAWLELWVLAGINCVPVEAISWAVEAICYGVCVCICVRVGGVY